MSQDLKINVNELDKEWMLLPQVYGEYAEKYESVDIDLRKAKVMLDLRRAEISKHIRENSKKYAKEYSVSSVTEGFINALCETDKEVQELQLKIISLERNKRLFGVMVKGLEMKKEALKNLTNLYQSEYFSIPACTRRMEEYVEAQEKFEGRDIRKEIKLKMRKNRETNQGENQ